MIGCTSTSFCPGFTVSGPNANRSRWHATGYLTYAGAAHPSLAKIDCSYGLPFSAAQGRGVRVLAKFASGSGGSAARASPTVAATVATKAATTMNRRIVPPVLAPPPCRGVRNVPVGERARAVRRTPACRPVSSCQSQHGSTGVRDGHRPRPPTARGGGGAASDVQGAARQLACASAREHGPALATRGHRLRAPTSRGVLVEHGRGRPRQRAAAHPAADRPTRPRALPAPARSALRAEADGPARARRRCARQRAHRPVHRPRPVRLRGRVRGPAPVASVPDVARPAARRPRRVPRDEGRHHPPGRRRRGQGVPTPHGALDLRILRPHPRRAQRRAARRPAQPAARRRVRGPSAEPGRDPRYLLPLPHRRPRHRHRHARVQLRPAGPATR